MIGFVGFSELDGRDVAEPVGVEAAWPGAFFQGQHLGCEGQPTKKARAAFSARFELEVDPEMVLPPAERARRAEAARRAYFTNLALRSSRARARRRRSGGSGG